MKQTKLQTMLRGLGACKDGINWADGHGLRKAWDTCERPDWMLWLCRKLKVDQKLMVAVACKCARTALIYIPKTENRPLEAIQTAERWLKGKATKEECRAAAAAAAAADAAYAAAADAAAADAAYAAAADADAAADAAYAAYAAAEAADAAYAAYAAAEAADAAYAAADAAAEAADAAYAAADAAYAAADDAGARARARKRQCVIIRGVVPYSVVYKAAKERGLI